MKKYELTDDKITLPTGDELRRIKALVDIGTDVKAGDFGGCSEKGTPTITLLTPFLCYNATNSTAAASQGIR